MAHAVAARILARRAARNKPNRAHKHKAVTRKAKAAHAEAKKHVSPEEHKRIKRIGSKMAKTAITDRKGKINSVSLRIGGEGGHEHTHVMIDQFNHKKTFSKLLSEIYNDNEETGDESTNKVVRARDDVEAKTLHNYTENVPYEETDKITRSILRHKIIMTEKLLTDHEKITDPKYASLSPAASASVYEKNIHPIVHKMSRAFHVIEHERRDQSGSPVPAFETLSPEEQDRHTRTALQAYFIVMTRPKQ